MVFPPVPSSGILQIRRKVDSRTAISQIKTGGTASSNPITFIWRNPYPVPIYADSIAASAGKLTECIVQLDLLPTQQRRQLGSILVQQQS